MKAIQNGAVVAGVVDRKDLGKSHQRVVMTRWCGWLLVAVVGCMGVERPENTTNELLVVMVGCMGVERPEEPTNESSGLVGSGGEWRGEWRGQKPTNESS